MTTQKNNGFFRFIKSIGKKEPAKPTESDIKLQNDMEFLKSEYKADKISVITLHADMLRRIKKLEQ